MQWLIENWQTVLVVWGAMTALVVNVMIFARIIVKLTPTPTDDNWWASVHNALLHMGLHVNPGEAPIQGEEDATAKSSSRPGAMGDPPAILLLFLLPLLALGNTGCMEPLAIRQSDAWIGTGIKTYAANNATVFKGWVDIYQMAREADADYTTQKVIDKLKTMNLTPEKMEIEVKSLIAHRDKVKADTAAVIKKMREAQAKNDAELAKVLVLKGKVSEWMEAGMTTEAIPAITAEVVNLVRTFYPEKPSSAP